MNIHILLHDPAADLLNLDLGSEGGGAYLHTAGLGAAGRCRGMRPEETGAAPSSGRVGNSL